METKRIYTSPQIKWIAIDNDISLALESTPPEGPNEGPIEISDNIHNHNSFKQEISIV